MDVQLDVELEVFWTSTGRFIVQLEERHPIGGPTGWTSKWTLILDVTPYFIRTEQTNNLWIHKRFWSISVTRTLFFQGTAGAVETLLKYAYQAANGMEYLAAQNLIHRDLALRNLLLMATQIVKIADFGMSRRHNKEYRKRLSPNVPAPIFLDGDRIDSGWSIHSEIRCVSTGHPFVIVRKVHNHICTLIYREESAA